MRLRQHIIGFITVLALLVPFSAKGQSGSSFYFMELSTNRTWYNPAFVTPGDLAVTIPGVGLHVQVDNNFLSWNNLIRRDNQDSLHIDVMRLLGNAGSNARLYAAADAEIFRASWRRGRNTYQVGALAHADVQMILDKESLAFVLQGPGEHVGNNQLKNNRIDLNSYAALYFGFAREFTRNFTFGGRIKLLHGLFNMHTDNLALNVDIQNGEMQNPDVVPFQYAVKMEGEVQTNIPLSGSLNFSPFRDLGLAFDFGFNYKFGKNWQVSAAVSDLGFIYWGEESAGTYYSHKKNPYIFSGFKMDGLNMDVDMMDFVTTTLNEAIDSLGFRKDKGKSGYTRALPASFNVGLSYTLKDIHCFGGAFRGMVYNKYFSPEVLVSYTVTPIKQLSICVSNTFTSGNYLNFGAAIVGNAGPLQIHLGIDRLNHVMLAKMQTFNINFGLTVVMGDSHYDWYTGK